METLNFMDGELKGQIEIVSNPVGYYSMIGKSGCLVAYRVDQEKQDDGTYNAYLDASSYSQGN